MRTFTQCHKSALIAVLISILGFVNCEAYDFSYNGIYYNINHITGTAEVTYADGYYNSYSGQIVIPSSVNYNGRTYEVGGIGESAFRNCSGLSAVTIGENVTTIGKRAFLNCTSLSAVEIPGAVTEVGDYAFAQCDNLEEVTFGNDAPIVIGIGAFMRCTRLTSVAWPTSLSLDGRGGVSIVETNAFAQCTSLVSIMLPGELQHLGSTIFDGCNTLSDITLTREVPLSIKNDPFALESSIVNIYVPSSGTEGETAALYSQAPVWRDYNIVELPYSFIDGAQCTYIKSTTGAVTLTGCIDPLSHAVAVRSTITDHGGNAYMVSAIGNEAFKGSSITSIDLSNAHKLKTIGTEAFAGCTRLTAAVLCEGVTTMGERAFAGCTSLAQVQVPSTLRVIPAGAFEDCVSLVDVRMVMGVGSISENAFARCTSLSTIMLPRSIAMVEKHAFVGATSLESVNVESGCRQYASFDGVLFESIWSEGRRIISALVLYPMHKPGEEFYVPCGVTTINENSMEGAAGLKSLTLPSTTTSFGAECFKDSGLEFINYRNANPVNENTDGLTAAIKANCTLQVPVGTVPIFTALTAWQGFKNIVERGNTYDDHSFAYEWNDKNEVTVVDVYPNAVSGNGTLTIPMSVTLSGYQYYITELGNSSTQNVAQIATRLEIGADSLSVIDTSNNLNPISALRNLSHIGISLSNPHFKLVDNILYNKTGSKLYYYLRSKPESSFTVPASVEVVMPQAFAWNSHLTSITFNNSIRQIEGRAFEGCSALQRLYNAKNISFIGDRAFAECSALSSFSGGEKLNRIGDEAFIDCHNLVQFPFAHGMLMQVGDRAFKGCSLLKTVVMGINAATIGDGVFENCSSLDAVFFSSEIEHFGNQVFKGCSSLDELWLMNATPPQVDNNFFAQSNIAQMQLFVPEDNVSSYRSTSPWSSASAVNISSYLFNGADVNGDNYVNAVDVTIVMNELLGDGNHDVVAHLDVNRDGIVSSIDITIIYNYMLNGVNLSMDYNFVKANKSSIESNVKLSDNQLKVQTIDPSTSQFVNLALTGYIDNPSVATLSQGVNQDGIPYLEITPLSTGYFTLVCVVSDGNTCYYRAFPLVVTQ